MTAKELF